MNFKEDNHDDDSLRSIMRDGNEPLDSCAADSAQRAWTMFAQRKARRQKLLNRVVPVCAMLLFVSAALFWNYANRSNQGTGQSQLAIATNTADSKVEAQLADLKRKINELQAQVDEQKRLLEQYSQPTSTANEYVSYTPLSQSDRIARLNRELDRRFETERAASTFLNFARRYAAENKKELAIVEYNRVLRSFGESDTAQIARKELIRLTTM